MNNPLLTFEILDIINYIDSYDESEKDFNNYFTKVI